MRCFTYSDVKIACIATAIPTNILEKQGVNLAISSEEQTTSDLGFEAAQHILTTYSVEPHEIGALIFLTKTPDYRGPATAMVIQHRLRIPQDCIVYDAPCGNAGFEQGLNLGASLLGSIHQKYTMVVFGDTLSKQLAQEDIHNLNFQDGASALLLEKQSKNNTITIGVTTLSDLWKNVMIPSGGFRNSTTFFKSLEGKRPHQLEEHFHINECSLEEHLTDAFMEIKAELIKIMSKDPNDSFTICVNLMLPSLEKVFKNTVLVDEFSKVKLVLHSETVANMMGATTPHVLAMLNEHARMNTSRVISISLGEGLSINLACFDTQDTLFLKTMKTEQVFDNGQVTHEM